MKRLFDITVSAALILTLLPVLVVLVVLVAVFLGRPVFFRQLRPGLNEKIFEMMKFRTMTDERGENNQLLPDEQRLTRFGIFLRKSSLDELPELLNILKGDMSLVGPRPLLVEYLPLYSDRQRRRHEVRPGLTGWAQINGRNTLDWPGKFELDVWYVDNRSFFLDLKILLLTVLKVLGRDGISHDGEATMPKFSGNER